MSDDRVDDHEQAFAELGTLLLEAELSVTDVRQALQDVHRAVIPEHGIDFAVLPEMVFLSPADRRRSTKSGVVTSPPLSIRQAVRVLTLVRQIETARVPVERVAEQAEVIRAVRIRHPHIAWSVGCALVSLGLTLVFRCPWWAVICASLMGVLIGVISTFMNTIRPAVSLVPFVSAFISTALLGVLVTWLPLGQVPLFAVCAPFAILVPGALITNGLLELTAADIVTGSARLMSGLIVLGFMLLGIVAGSALTGLRINSNSATLIGQTRNLVALDGAWQQLPPVSLGWIGVIALAVGVSVAFGAGYRLTILSVVMMACTYGVLDLLTPLVGSVVATGIAGATLFVVSRLLERTKFAVPAAISFRPAFLLLVPGTIGLVALTAFGSGTDTAAPFTFLSLCIGVKVGSVLTDTAWWVSSPWWNSSRK